MVHDNIHKSFYFPFKGLRYAGLWLSESENGPKKILYYIYKIIVIVFNWQIVGLGIMDLYVHWNDITKVILNWCTTVFTLVVTCKSAYILNKSDRIEILRIQLHEGSQVLADEEDVEILKKFQKMLTAVQMLFIVAFLLFYPFWMAPSLISLKWGPRELPFPVWLPLNLEDNRQFAFGFIYQALGGTFVVAIAALSDLTLYSLLLQIIGQYAILNKNVIKVNDLYNSKTKKEKNKYLLQLILRNKFRELLKKQAELNQYIAELEGSYNPVMLMQLTGGLVVAVGNGLQLIVFWKSFSIKLIYQIAFFLIIICDMFVSCALSHILANECENINAALYSLEWYEMEIANRKDILLMIMGTQKTPTLTAGKLLPLNLRTYIGFIKNLYSWLALFRQIVLKN